MMQLSGIFELVSLDFGMNLCQALNYTESSGSYENFLGSSKFRVPALSGYQIIKQTLTFCICPTVNVTRFKKYEKIAVIISLFYVSDIV